MNQSYQYSLPLALGDAQFKIDTAAQGMTRVILDKLSLRIGGNDNAVCLSESEDALWGIVVKPLSEVAVESDPLLRVQPNPFDERIRIMDEANAITAIEMFDVLGHRIPIDLSTSGEIGTTGMSSDASFIVCQYAHIYIFICRSLYHR